MGEFTPTQIVASTGLSLPVVDQAIEILRRERLVEVKGVLESRNLLSACDHRRGAQRGNDLMQVCRYAGRRR